MSMKWIVGLMVIWWGVIVHSNLAQGADVTATLVGGASLPFHAS